jgi:hypothetical protein
MSSSHPTPTIALVAVPGPGDDAPGVAARSVSDLLLRLRQRTGSRYASFVERSIRIPTKPACVNPRSAPNVAPDLRPSPFAEQHPFLRTQLEYAGAAARDREEDSPDHQLMRAQLAGYRSTATPYDTIRLEGERISEPHNGAPPDIQTRLHVYEMRWSDLVRPASRVRRLCGELYQLFLHVAHLGRTALDHARLEHSTSRLWRLYGGTHTWAVRILTAVIPAIFVTMLATIAAVPVVGLLSSTARVAQAALIVWLVGAGILILRGFRAYDRLRPGAWIVGLGVYTLSASSVIVSGLRARNEDELLDSALHVFQAEAIAAAVAWDALYLLGALAGAVGLVACGRLRGVARARAWRAARTAATTLAVATASTVVATFVTWAVVLRIVAETLPARSFDALIPSFHRPGQSFPGFFERVLEVSTGAGAPLLMLTMMALFVLGVLVLAPAVYKEIRPPRAGELFDERANGSASATREGPIDTDLRWAAWERHRREGDASQRLAMRLSRGTRAITALLVALYLSVFVVSPAASVTHLFAHVPALERLYSLGDAIILVVGTTMATLVVGLVTLRNGLGRLARGFAPLVEIVLAVDAYLRTHPRDSAPRARIAERYTSLLRYLCHWRDRSGRPYDAIVLVAQSQGAAITADVLSFVQREEDPELEPIRRPLANGAPGAAGRRLFLFTMGTPLRQLYSEWFPHLFGWVRGEIGDGVARPLPAVPREPWMLLPRLEDGHRVYAPPIPDNAPPDPYTMGLTRWVNAYRSGDYVGRAIWRHAIEGCDWLYRAAPADAATRFVGDVPPVTYVSEDAHRSRRELCIGGGAHTHYWDATAKAIAIELDLLLTDATRMAVRVSRDTGAPTEGMES